MPAEFTFPKPQDLLMPIRVGLTKPNVLTLLLVLNHFVQAETISPGSACHSITPGQALKMEWRKEGLKNGAPREFWVNCPFARTSSKSELNLSVRAVNETSSNLDLSCTLREILGGDQAQGKLLSQTVSANSSQVFQWTVQPQYRKSIFNAACLLPNGIAIEAVESGFSGRCTKESLEGVWSFDIVSYGRRTYTHGVAELNVDGTISAVLTENGADIRQEVVGEYRVDDDQLCEVSGFILGGTITFKGTLSEDQKTLNGASYNSAYGEYSNAILTKVNDAVVTKLRSQ